MKRTCFARKRLKPAALDLEPSNPNFANVPHAEPNLPIRDATGSVRAVTQ
eukprot:gene32367-41021_t